MALLGNSPHCTAYVVQSYTLMNLLYIVESGTFMINDCDSRRLDKLDDGILPVLVWIIVGTRSFSGYCFGLRFFLFSEALCFLCSFTTAPIFTVLKKVKRHLCFRKEAYFLSKQLHCSEKLGSSIIFRLLRTYVIE